MKQYYQTMAHLRYWRRDIAESNEDDQETLQSKNRSNQLEFPLKFYLLLDMLREYKNFEYKR